MNTFESLSLHPSLSQALKAMNFSTPTPIQAESIPVALQGKDILGCAQTGTGKTAAFSIPMLTRILELTASRPNPKAAPSGPGPRPVSADSYGPDALILAPTRELAMQIQQVIEELCQCTKHIKTVLLIGGASMPHQVRNLRGRPQIVIATPGRLIDHLERRTIKLSTVTVLVLDEADRMLDMGFAPQLNRILPALPKQRQTMLFSATFPKGFDSLTKNYLRDPVRITVGAVSKPVTLIDQSVKETTQQNKNNLLLDELNARKGSILIFARTQSRTERLARYLNEYGHDVAQIHGGRSQGQRNTALQGFRDGRFRILVATDIVARGIDISEIGHVINFDLPQVAEDYVHRIGRTGRAGASGEALSLLAPEDRKLWREIVQLISKTPGAKIPTPQKAAGVPTMAIAPNGTPKSTAAKPSSPPTQARRESSAGSGRIVAPVQGSAVENKHRPRTNQWEPRRTSAPAGKKKPYETLNLGNTSQREVSFSR